MDSFGSKYNQMNHFLLVCCDPSFTIEFGAQVVKNIGLLGDFLGYKLFVLIDGESRRYSLTFLYSKVFSVFDFICLLHWPLI